MRKLLITDTRRFTECFHEVSIAFDLSYSFIFLWFLSNSFNFIFFDIPPCICWGGFCDWGFLLITGWLLLMLVVALFNNTRLLLESRSCGFLWYSPSYCFCLYRFYNFLIIVIFRGFYKFFGKNTILLGWTLNGFLCFWFSDFWKRSINLVVWKIL